MLCYELMTGSVPWGDLSPAELIDKVAKKGEKCAVPKWMGKDWKKLIESCLNSNAKSRWTMTEVLTHLSKCPPPSSSY